MWTSRLAGVPARFHVWTVTDAVPTELIVMMDGVVPTTATAMFGTVAYGPPGYVHVATPVAPVIICTVSIGAAGP